MKLFVAEVDDRGNILQQAVADATEYMTARGKGWLAHFRSGEACFRWDIGGQWNNGKPTNIRKLHKQTKIEAPEKLPGDHWEFNFGPDETP